MKNLKLVLFLFFFSLSIKGFSQKAYENIYYEGKIKNLNLKVKFVFANGYFDASNMTVLYSDKKKNINNTFHPAYNRSSDTIKFIHYSVKDKGFSDYFKLENLQEDYTEIPKTVKGIYHFKGIDYDFILTHNR